MPSPTTAPKLGRPCSLIARKPHQRSIILIYRTLLEAWHRYGTEWMYLIRSPLVPDGRGCGDHRPISSVLTVMPRKPAACQIGTPRCIIQVARVWRNVCSVTLFGP